MLLLLLPKIDGAPIDCGAEILFTIIILATVSLALELGGRKLGHLSELVDLACQLRFDYWLSFWKYGLR